MGKRVFLMWVLVLALAAIWFFAGYAIGLKEGKGWRGQMIEDGCSFSCEKWKGMSISDL